MVMQGMHAALASVRRDERGGFAGLAAGQAYSAPARTYYRDGYWTVQALLPHAPEIVRGEIRLLAERVLPDGEAPSGVIVSGAAQSRAWDAFRRTAPRYRDEHRRKGEWWSDHFDSPLFLVLMLGDYVRQTDDRALAHEVWPAVRAIYERATCASTRPAPASPASRAMTGIGPTTSIAKVSSPMTAACRSALST